MKTSESAGGDIRHALVPDDLLAAQALPPEEFRAAFRHHAAGVAVITADAGEGPVGMTSTSVFSVSVTPPLLVFSISDLSSATPVILRSRSVVVHLLGADQVALARLCSTSGIDRFADASSWSRLPTGEPYFTAAQSWMRGTVVGQLRAGASTLVVVNATHAHRAGASHDAKTAVQPLVYHDRTWHHLGEHSALYTKETP